MLRVSGELNQVENSRTPDINPGCFPTPPNHGALYQSMNGSASDKEQTFICRARGLRDLSRRSINMPDASHGESSMAPQALTLECRRSGPSSAFAARLVREGNNESTTIKRVELALMQQAKRKSIFVLPLEDCHEIRESKNPIAPSFPKD